ncbi:hypothetical protein KTE13_17990 [Burkholderia multivorans]|uniref:SGNH/GDSL hydrolase family protein n=1 Tax=Burkholderia multivorans TaxID=87883 RepID=UPI001C21F5A7|nr:GDSL-type esterase/lipase family protein [Burkholderia multivorans]MBU9401630.1 hypothetical protein [Burkholderia multivorans]
MSALIRNTRLLQGIVAPNMSSVLDKLRAGSAVSIACYGDSITYGQDTTASGVPGSQINGATQTRSTQQFPENMGQALQLAGYGTNPTVINRGFPGDSTVQGLSRWAGASATDVSFIMYGHNDANNYGGNGVVSLAKYRVNLALLVDREIAKGAVVVVLGPPNVQDDNANETIRPYATAAKEVARMYGVEFVDCAEVLQTITAYHTDGIHLTSFAYAELGWALSGLFMKRNGDMQRITGGEIFYPDDALGHCPAGNVINWTGGKGNNRLIQLTPGQVYAVGIDCLADVTPVIHSICVSGTNGLSYYYAGGTASDKGVPTAILSHNSTYGLRQSLVCPELKKGRRAFFIRNDSSSTSYIEAIEFFGKEAIYTSHGNVFRSSALSNLFAPTRISAAQPDWWCAVDTARKVAAPYGLIARVTLVDSVANGLAVWKQLPVAASGGLFGVDALMVLRQGTSLIIREYIGGAANDTAIASQFTAGAWTGEIEVQTTTSGISVYLNGTLAGTRNTPTLLAGFPGLIAAAGAAIQCQAMYFNGHVKGPY